MSGTTDFITIVGLYCVCTVLVLMLHCTSELFALFITPVTFNNVITVVIAILTHLEFFALFVAPL